ncbi:MAG: small multi-drug export protein [Candidatus Marinimicrobia bacterium]|nr:small multi-drug export protein [Candidatus Neomarinimicrobiota bacterium]
MAETLIPYIDYISSNPLVATFILAMLPITELRGAIPWAYFFTEISPMTIYATSIAGNFLVTFPIVNLLTPAIKFLSRWNIGAQFFEWILNRTRRRGAMIEKYHFWGLVLFVGIPLPVTGAWTGCIAAHLFGIPKVKALSAILLGLCLSASIVTALLVTGKWIISA